MADTAVDKLKQMEAKLADAGKVQPAIAPPPDAGNAIGMAGQCEQGPALNPDYAWTKEQEDQLLVYLKDTKSFQELADKLKRPKWAVQSKLRDMVNERTELAHFKKVLK